MGIFKRITDIISANLNDMADQFEDPEVMLKQAVREMEQSINEVTSQTAKVMASEKTVAKELDRNRQQVAQWQERAVKAVEAGDDDLARRALVRKSEHEKLVTALEDQLESAKESSTTLRRQLEAMKAKLSEAKRSLATLSARKRAADFSKRMASQAICVPAEADEDAFARFDRLRAKVEQAEAEAEAWQELRAGDRPATSAEPEPETAVKNTEIDAQLAELKSKTKHS